MLNLDQIRTASPILALDGTETFIVNQSGVTKGGFLSDLLEWIAGAIEIGVDAITEAGPYAATILGFADLEDAQAELLPIEADTAAILAGTELELRSFAPKSIFDAITDVVENATDPIAPLEITTNTTLADTIQGRTVVCDGAAAVELTLESLALPLGTKFKVINLAVDDVTVTPDLVTFIDSTGAIADLTLVQHASATFEYIALDTWYID